MNNPNLNKGQFNPTVPFADKQKRAVRVSASFDPSLQLPSASDIKSSQKVMANPPIMPKTAPNNLVQFDFDNPTPMILDTKTSKVISNTPDLIVFEEPDNSAVPEMVEMRVNDKIDNNPFSERIALPSKGVFYDFDSVVIRPFNVPELALLYKAKKRKDIVLLYDCLNKTLNVDIRMLWTIDARHIMYWHRMNSFTKTPYKATWESLYGNVNKTKITMTDINVTPVEMTKQRYKEWLSKGIKIPDVRDSEHLETFKGRLSEEDLWMYERAQYLVGDGLHEQKKKLESEKGIDILYDIKDFIEEISDSGIQEVAQAKDEHFNYASALKRLSEDLDFIDETLNTELGINEITEELLLNRKAKVVSELERLSNLKPGEAEPLLETITLRLGILDFFPDI